MSLLRLSGVTVKGPERPRLVDISLEVQAGHCVMLLGPNGAGKSTLLRTALGLERSEGSVLLGNDPTHRLSPKERAARAAWLPQRMALSDPLSVLDVVVLARYRFGEAHRVSQAQAQRALSRLSAGHLAARLYSNLSGGEQQRVHLASLLAQESPLLLLDEPASHLDPAQQLEVYRLISELWQTGLGVVCATHDVNLLCELGNPEKIRVFGIDEGRMAFDMSLSDDSFGAALGELFGIEFLRIPVLQAGPSQGEHFYYLPKPGAPRKGD